MDFLTPGPAAWTTPTRHSGGVCFSRADLSTSRPRPANLTGWRRPRAGSGDAHDRGDRADVCPSMLSRGQSGPHLHVGNAFGIVTVKASGSRAPAHAAAEISRTAVRRPGTSDITFAVGFGELVAIVGPNGSGKSTLLKALAGLLRPWAGAIAVLGQPPGRQPLRVAYLPQAEAVDWSFPVSVRDVVLMGRYRRAGWLRSTSGADAAAAEHALELVGIHDLAGRLIGELSGGQQRRAFVARALAQQPDLYLLDEPVTGVDPTTEDELMAILEAECRQGKTVLASTHDLAGVAEHFTRLISLNRTVVADGPAALVRDAGVLRATFGGHLIEVDRGDMVLLDDPHHGDVAR